MTRPLKLTLLDLPRATQPLFPFAAVAERAGFSRYWLTEHFEPKPDGVGSSVVCAAAAAAVTKKIRIGTAGILIRYYPAAMAAIQFRALAALFPGRIDAGLAGGWTPNKDALEQDLQDWVFDSKVERTVTETRSGPWQPMNGTPPPLWYFGASANSARMAGPFGIGYGYALQFTTNQDNPEAIAAYRRSFIPNPFQHEPAACIAVAGLCSDSVADAERSVATALETWAGGTDPRIVGTPQMCRDALHELAARYQVDDIVFMNLSREWEPACRSIELLGEALALGKP
jgi:luciferase family oxidoreductase group 1